MKTKNQKKTIKEVTNQVPHGAIKPNQAAGVVGGNNPWIEQP